VWLSEIMLQQTTVAAVKPYFEYFITTWPTVQDLALSSLDDINAAWAGLGYYRRAANLHKAAKVVSEDYNGIFPETAEALLSLPGIGAYTSAAIASIAFDEPVAVVDGNVERVMTRLRAIETPLPQAKKQVLEYLNPLVPKDRPGDFAQAMMDLGATICTPKQPACSLCPWNPNCKAYKLGRQEDFPVKVPKKIKPIRRGVAYVILRKSDSAVLVEKRPDTGLLAGMVQVPCSDWTHKQDDKDKAPPLAIEWQSVGEVEHVFTHFRLILDVRAGHTDTAAPNSMWFVKQDELDKEALPTVMLKVLKKAIPDLKIIRRAKSGLAD
jgi:A/G-specific adenine glycosylase